MKQIRTKALVIVLALMLFGIFTISEPVFAEAEQKNASVFVDFDGDGINDNIDDSDGDGIPDTADPDFVEEEVVIQVENAMDFGSTISEMGLSADISSNSDKYGESEFNARCLSSNRCGFTSEEGFGGEGLGVDVGGGGGGACAGGVCR